MDCQCLLQKSKLKWIVHYRPFKTKYNVCTMKNRWSHGFLGWAPVFDELASKSLAKYMHFQTYMTKDYIPIIYFWNIS